MSVAQIARYGIATLLAGGFATSMADVLVQPDSEQLNWPSSSVGTDNSTAIKNSKEVWQERGKAVAMIVIKLEGGGTVTGTGFLISDDMMITAEHVYKNAQDMDSISVWFDYLDKTEPYEIHRPNGWDGEPDTLCSTPDIWKVSDKWYTSASNKMDVAMFQLETKNNKRAGEIYGHLKVKSKTEFVTVGQKVHAIHHQSSGCKEYSHDNKAKVIREVVQEK